MFCLVISLAGGSSLHKSDFVDLELVPRNFWSFTPFESKKALRGVNRYFRRAIDDDSQYSIDGNEVLVNTEAVEAFRYSDLFASKATIHLLMAQENAERFLAVPVKNFGVSPKFLITMSEDYHPDSWNAAVLGRLSEIRYEIKELDTSVFDVEMSNSVSHILSTALRTHTLSLWSARFAQSWLEKGFPTNAVVICFPIDTAALSRLVEVKREFNFKLVFGLLLDYPRFWPLPTDAMFNELYLNTLGHLPDSSIRGRTVPLGCHPEAEELLRAVDGFLDRTYTISDNVPNTILLPMMSEVSSLYFRLTGSLDRHLAYLAKLRRTSFPKLKSALISLTVRDIDSMDMYLAQVDMLAEITLVQINLASESPEDLFNLGFVNFLFPRWEKLAIKSEVIAKVILPTVTATQTVRLLKPQNIQVV